MFDTKAVVLVHQDLLTWQKLNVTAFLATGIASAVPNAIGDQYVNASGREFAAMLGQPIMVLAATEKDLARAYRIGGEHDLISAVYVRAMFATGHDSANRDAFQREDPDSPDLVGLALYGSKRSVDKATKGAKLHP